MKESIVLTLALSILFFCCSEKKTPGNLTNDLHLLIDKEFEANHFHGSIVVSKNDSIVFERHIGIANRVWNTSVGKNTVFDIASVNKSFIATLVLLAVEEGKMRLEDRLVDRLKGYSYLGRFDSSITIHHMLSHSSGLPDYDGVSSDLSANGFRTFKRLHFSNEGYVNFISTIDRVSIPDKRFYYSNFAYHLLCILLEDVYDTPFPDLLSQKICVPLGMNNTFSSTDNQLVLKNIAEGYNYSEKEKIWKRNNFIDLTLGRRIFSTATDLEKWARCMDDNSLLNNSSLLLMKKNHLKTLSTYFSYGYGWVVFEKGDSYEMGNLDIDLPYIIHGGSTEGYKSMLVNIDNGRYIISFLSNVGDRTDEMELAKGIVKHLINATE